MSLLRVMFCLECSRGFVVRLSDHDDQQFVVEAVCLPLVRGARLRLLFRHCWRWFAAVSSDGGHAIVLVCMGRSVSDVTQVPFLSARPGRLCQHAGRSPPLLVDIWYGLVVLHGPSIMLIFHVEVDHNNASIG